MKPNLNRAGDVLSTVLQTPLIIVSGENAFGLWERFLLQYLEWPLVQIGKLNEGCP